VVSILGFIDGVSNKIRFFCGGSITNNSVFLVPYGLVIIFYFVWGRVVANSNSIILRLDKLEKIIEF
jgi:hypothetical protein